MIVTRYFFISASRDGFPEILLAYEHAVIVHVVFILRYTYQFIAVFTVDNLMHLRRTGRCSNAKAAIGTVLNIKPLLKGNELGQIVTYGQVRGRKKSLIALARSYEEHVQDAQNQTIGIAHAGCIEDAVYLISLLKQTKYPPKDILTVMYEPVTGSHVGPGTLALFFLGDENVRSLKMPEI